MRRKALIQIMVTNLIFNDYECVWLFVDTALHVSLGYKSMRRSKQHSVLHFHSVLSLLEQLQVLFIDIEEDESFEMCKLQSAEGDSK